MSGEVPTDGTADGPEFWTWPKLCGVVIAVWVVAGLAPFVVAPPLMKWSGVDPAQTGTFGDTFGVVNSLFSALGVAGVAYALILQTREYRDARRESEDAKKHAAELALFSALVNGRSALVHARSAQVGQSYEIMRDVDPVERAAERAKLRAMYNRFSMELGEEARKLIELVEAAEDELADLGPTIAKKKPADAEPDPTS